MPTTVAAKVVVPQRAPAPFVIEKPSAATARTMPNEIAVTDPVYWGDRWGFLIWLSGAAFLVFLHVCSLLACYLRR
jgi:hypothetical protein